MMPLMTRRSSTLRASGWFVGNSGLIAAQARSESQNPEDILHSSCHNGGSELDDAS
jgi:hypothetical protein